MLLVLTLSACAGRQVTIPDWSAAEREPKEITDPIQLPLLCEIPWATTECWAAVEQYEVVSEGNTAIAQANADALRKSEAAYDHLIEAGKLQQQYAQLREEMLDEEKREHLYDNLFHRVIIVTGLIALAL